jgi:hypothetical protein
MILKQLDINIMVIRVHQIIVMHIYGNGMLKMKNGSIIVILIFPFIVVVSITQFIKTDIYMRLSHILPPAANLIIAA